MSSRTYRMHHRRRNRRRLKLLAAAVLLVLVVGGMLFVRSLRPDTVLTQAAPVTKTVASDHTTKHWDKDVFTIDLPSDWQFDGLQHSPYTIYHWHSTAKNADNRTLDIYQDSTPSRLAVNRLVPVQGSGDHLLVDSANVSDNCATFTPAAPAGAQPGVLAKWQGVAFLCDAANTTRNVVGTGAFDGLNTVNLTGPSSGKHHFFFTYTENNYQPNYTVFTEALTSFRLK